MRGFRQPHGDDEGGLNREDDAMWPRLLFFLLVLVESPVVSSSDSLKPPLHDEANPMVRRCINSLDCIAYSHAWW